MRHPFANPMFRTAVPAILLAGTTLAVAGEQKLARARCTENLCLVYLLAQDDSDGDGVSDADEKAMGTDPYDAKSHPSSLEIAKQIGQGRLESFDRGFSEIVILPTKGPDGGELVQSSVRELKSGTLDALGISGKTLSRFGIATEGGFTFSSAMPMPGEGDKERTSEDAPPPRKIGGIIIALYSEDENGVDMGAGICMGCKNPESETVKTEGSWWDKVKEFFGGTKDDGDKPDGGKPDAGTYTDPDAVPVVAIGELEYRRAWFKAKGGTVSRTVGGDLPKPTDGVPPILGRDPTGPIILVNPDESGEYFGKRSKLIVIPDPEPLHTAGENTDFGPVILGGIRPGSAVPKD